MTLIDNEEFSLFQFGMKLELLKKKFEEKIVRCFVSTSLSILGFLSEMFLFSISATEGVTLHQTYFVIHRFFSMYQRIDFSIYVEENES
jgi:hypothetical protein